MHVRIKLLTPASGTMVRLVPYNPNETINYRGVLRSETAVLLPESELHLWTSYRFNR
jgi:hypothetical protein